MPAPMPRLAPVTTAALPLRLSSILAPSACEGGIVAQSSHLVDGANHRSMITERLSQFLATHRPEDVPERVRHEAKRSLVNFFAAALGGCRNEAVEILVATLAACFGPPQATDRKSVV